MLIDAYHSKNVVVGTGSSYTTISRYEKFISIVEGDNHEKVIGITEDDFVGAVVELGLVPEVYRVDNNRTLQVSKWLFDLMMVAIDEGKIVEFTNRETTQYKLSSVKYDGQPLYEMRSVEEDGTVGDWQLAGENCFGWEHIHVSNWRVVSEGGV